MLAAGWQAVSKVRPLPEQLQQQGRLPRHAAGLAGSAGSWKAQQIRQAMQAGNLLSRLRGMYTGELSIFETIMSTEAAPSPPHAPHFYEPLADAVSE